MVPVTSGPHTVTAKEPREQLEAEETLQATTTTVSPGKIDIVLPNTDAGSLPLGQELDTGIKNGCIHCHNTTAPLLTRCGSKQGPPKPCPFPCQPLRAASSQPSSFGPAGGTAQLTERLGGSSESPLCRCQPWRCFIELFGLNQESNQGARQGG